jgi:hypothetical protein
MTGGLSSSSVGGSPGGYTDGISSSPMSSSKSPLRYGSQQDSVDSSYNSQYDHSLLHHQQVRTFLSRNPGLEAKKNSKKSKMLRGLVTSRVVWQQQLREIFNCLIA